MNVNVSPRDLAAKRAVLRTLEDAKRRHLDAKLEAMRDGRLDDASKEHLAVVWLTEAINQERNI